MSHALSSLRRGWCGSVCAAWDVAFSVMQGRREGGQHHRWSGLPWQSESPQDLQTLHRITARRIQFNPLSVHAALGDVTNIYNTFHDVESTSFVRGSDGRQASQRCGGDSTRPRLAVDVCIGGGAFSQLQQQMRTLPGIRRDVMWEEGSEELEPGALNGTPDRHSCLVRSDVGQPHRSPSFCQPASIAPKCKVWQWTDVQMAAAMAAVERGGKIRVVVRNFDIPASTLTDQ